MPVQKLTVSFDVLVQADSPEGARDIVKSISLSEIVRRCEDDDMIRGSAYVTGAVEIDPERVKRELEAMGNDGTFFNNMDDDIVDHDRISDGGVSFDHTAAADGVDPLRSATCDSGLHSWIDQTGILPADTKCTRCGEPYGDPK